MYRTLKTVSLCLYVYVSNGDIDVCQKWPVWFSLCTDVLVCSQRDSL